MDVVSREIEKANPRSILEVGPGLGAAAWFLAINRDYLGYEPDPESCRVADSRLEGHSRASVVNSPIPDEPTRQFDALVAMEVLEHIERDEDALRMWRRWVRPGGTLLISVPAKSHRFGPYDEAVGHYRRYEKDELTRLMTRAGLEEVEVVAYGMPLGYLLEFVRNRLLVKRLERHPASSDRTSRSGRSFQPRSAAWLISTLTWPFRLLQRPFERTRLGIGWVAWGKVPP